MDGDATRALRAELGGDPPEGLVEVLRDEEIAALAALIADARERRTTDLDRGVQRALTYVPAPLRTPVRRIIG